MTYLTKGALSNFKKLDHYSRLVFISNARAKGMRVDDIALLEGLVK
jgi:hypothetical protein